jgi:hypothetical protein
VTKEDYGRGGTGNTQVVINGTTYTLLSW